MKLNKLVITKVKEKIFVVGMSEQEFEDLRSAVRHSIPIINFQYKNSPKFRRAIHKLDRSLLTILKDVRNREKQKQL